MSRTDAPPGIAVQRSRCRLALIAGTAILAASSAPVANAAAPTDLFISEYVEGTGNNKAIELFNGTGGAIDLAAGNYQLALYTDNAAAPAPVISLTGVVAAGDVFVLANSTAIAPVVGAADQLSASLTFNGNDVVVLRKGAQATVLDSIGQIGAGPAVGWGGDPTNTADNTLVRKPTVGSGDTDPTNSYDPAAEWNGHPVDTFTFLGSHSFASSTGGVAATVTIADSAACLQLSTNSIDFGNLSLGASDQVAAPTVAVTNCSTGAATLLARGTNATGTGATWSLVDSAATCSGSLGLDNYRLSLMSPGLAAPVSLGTTNKTIHTLAGGESRNHEAHIWTACPGSSGAGKVMSFQIQYLVTSP